MSKYNLHVLWDNVFPNTNEVYDYAGRRMLKSAIGNQYSRYCPTIDHIRPLSKGGKDLLENIIICNKETNEDKATNSQLGILTIELSKPKELEALRMNTIFFY